MLTPILRRSGREESRREKEHMEAEVVAAYFWLSLGTDVGYFPRPFAVRLAKHRFTEFLNTWHDLFATRGDLFAPDFRIALETIENRRNTVLPPSEPFENLKLLQLFFREALAIEIGTLRDQPLVTSMAALTLLNIADLGLRPLERVLFVAKLTASSLAVELPVDFHAITVHPPIPGSRFSTQSLEIGDSSAA